RIWFWFRVHVQLKDRVSFGSVLLSGLGLGSGSGEGLGRGPVYGQGQDLDWGQYTVQFQD
ncbi:hypothetical protein BSL67_16695, partial [Acinetobacter baylyi]